MTIIAYARWGPRSPGPVIIDTAVVTPLCLYTHYTSGAIDADYYYNSLRSSDCYTPDGEKACRAYCGELDMMCHRGRCYCEERAVPKKPQFGNVLFNYTACIWAGLSAVILLCNTGDIFSDIYFF